MATAIAADTTPERELELDGGPSDPRFASQAPQPDPTSIAALATSLVLALAAAPTIEECDRIAREAVMGPIGTLPRQHPFRTSVRNAHSDRVAALAKPFLGALAQSFVEPAPVAPQALPQAVQPDPSTIEGALAAVASEAKMFAPSAAKREIVVSGETDRRATVREAINGGTGMVAVAGAIASGVALSWDGQGELNRGQIRDALVQAGLPVEWAPAALSAHGILGLVMQRENRDGHVARAERNVSARQARTLRGADGMPRSYHARYTVQRPSHGVVGEHAGEIVATIALLADSSLHCEGDERICSRVRLEYERRLDTCVYEAGQVSEWIKSLLIGRWGAIRFIGWYVPAQHATAARAFVASMALTGWGHWPANPPMPMLTCDALSQGLAASLTADIRIVLNDLDKAREAARKAKKETVPQSTAETFITTLRGLATRAERVADILGSDHVRSLLGELRAAARECELARGTDTIVERFRNLECY